MANTAKRMRALTDKVYHVRNGSGSIVLPSGPQPQLKSIFMRIHTGSTISPGWYDGARDFWRRELQRLKYWNPSLSVTVETVRDETAEEPMYLSVEYESSNQDDLANLKAAPLPKPLYKLPLRELRQHKDRTWPSLPNTQKTKLIASSLVEARKRRTEKIPSSILEQLNGHFRFQYEPLLKLKEVQPVQLTPDILSVAPKDEIKTKAQSAADPSQPQSTSPPTAVYTRTLTTPIAGVRHTELWQWIRQHTGLPDHHRTEKGEEHQYQDLVKFKKQAEKDRQLVKAGLKVMRAEQEQLKKAKALADQMTADAA